MSKTQCDKPVSPAMRDLLVRCAANDFNTAYAARQELAVAIETPLKQGVIRGDIYSGIYNRIDAPPGVSMEYPVDFLAPGTEGDYVAWTMPAMGRIPERHVEGDYLTLQTYEISHAINAPLKYIRDARWDVVTRMLKVLETGFVRKFNTDAWRVILAASAGRNLAVYDDAATAGYFTKRLVELMKTYMIRYAGANTSSVMAPRLTNLYLSPESLGDMRSWTLLDADDKTRHEIYVRDDLNGYNMFGITLTPVVEMGVGQEFQNYLVNNLGLSLPGSPAKTEFCVGLDQSTDNAFLSPVRQEITVNEDPGMLRSRQFGLYAYTERGFSQCDARRVLLGAI